MVTFSLICIVIGLALALIIATLVVLGFVASGCLLIALDVAIGILPFVLLVLLIKWLSKKKDEGGKEQDGNEQS